MTLTELANPTRFLSLATRILPWLAMATGILLAIGLYQSAMAPDDYQQGATVKIMFIHVPNAWLSMFVWGVMSVASLGTLVWRHPLADVAAKSAAPIGAAFTFLALVTGSLWGRPMWGTYWEWDARLTSVLILFLMYLGLIALWRAVEDPSRAARAAAVLTLGRRHQYSDHQVLGRLVEYAASAGVGDEDGRLVARQVVSDSPAGDGGGILTAVHHAASRGHA
jgi:heme exporter protein C